MASPPSDPAPQSPKDAYSQVLEFLDDFDRYRAGRPGLGSHSPELYEKTFSIKVTPDELFRLRTELRLDSGSDQRFPKYEFNASTSTFSVQCTPSPIQWPIVSTVTAGFARASGSLPASVQGKFSVAGGDQDFNCFQGRYRGSRKTPDLAVKFADENGDLDPKFVVEVGCSESYLDLVQEAILWLEGDPRVSVVVIVDFEEKPPFRCPTRDLDDKKLEMLGFPDRADAEDQQFVSQGDYGPVTYKGLDWTGRFSTVFAEVWRRDPESGFATQSGDRVNLLETTIVDTPPPELTFQLGEFLDIAQHNNSEISFRWDEFRTLLRSAVKELAISRCQDLLDRREGLLADDDPAPPSEAEAPSS